jgi:glycosyltransferase involved in cell wall biosynthesis
MNKFHIVVPFYNVEQWISNCIKSIKGQDYKNYSVTLVNDCSTDKTVEIINNLISEDDRFKLINTKENGGALNSTYTGINDASPLDEDIIIVLDGDDWFSSRKTLDIVNDAYNDHNCLITYGSYVTYPDKDRGKFSRQIPDWIVKDKMFRQNPWMSSHLRTFKAKLWNAIKKEDITGKDGKIYSMAGDLPVVFPMLEMAEERSYFIEDIVHVYNRANPLNEDKVNHQLQLSIEQEVRRKKTYPRFEEVIDDKKN